MKYTFITFLRLFVICCVALSVAAYAQSQPVSKQKNMNMTKKQLVAKGTFEVKVTPLPPEENIGDATIGRLSLDKQFSGDIVGTAKGQMLGIGTDIKESAGYVAAERVHATVNGKKGSFALQHSGTMQAGKFDLTISIVPDSGTGELKGIAGTMKIVIDSGKHSYELSYTLPAEN